MGHGLMENRQGLLVKAWLTLAHGHAERVASLHMIEPRADRPRAITLAPTTRRGLRQRVALDGADTTRRNAEHERPSFGDRSPPRAIVAMPSASASERCLVVTDAMPALLWILRCAIFADQQGTICGVLFSHSRIKYFARRPRMHLFVDLTRQGNGVFIVAVQMDAQH